RGPAFKITFQGANGSTGEATSKIFNYTYKQWQEVAMQFEVPEGTTFAYVYPRLYGSGTIYYDDVEVYMVKEIPKAKISATHVYYTDWEQGTIELDFLDEAFNGYTYDITITDGETVLLNETVSAADYIDYKFNLGLLSELQKEYTLDVELKDADGNVVETLNKDIYRYNRPTIMTENAQVKDGNGNVFYPVLGYHAYYEDLDECAQYGINVVRSYISMDGTISARVGRTEDLVEWLDTAWYDYGIMTLVQMYSGKSAGHITMAESVTQTVNAIKNHPGLLGYLVQDEPYNSWDTEQVTAELKAAYKLIRSLDSDHIVAHVANRPQHWDKSIDLSDMVISDRYPTADETYFRNLQYNYISNAKAYSNYEKPVWNLIQASSFGGYVPTGTKLRNMIYQTMFAGGDAIGYIAVSAADSSGNGLLLNEDELQMLAGLKNDELDDAVKAFVTNEYPTFCENGGAPLLDNYADFLTYQVPESYWYKAYYKNNDLYLLILNNENESVNVSIPLVSTDGNTTIGGFTAEVADSYSADNNVSGNGTFATTIAARAATLFKITPTGEAPVIPEPETPEIENLLLNGGFESVNEDGKPANWTLSSTTVLGTNFEMSDSAKTGNSSAKMFGNTTGAALLSQIVSDIEPGEEYEFSAQLRTVSLTPATSSRGAEVDIAFRDANNATIQYNGANQARQIVKTISGENWQDVNIDFTAPEGTAKVIVYLRLYNGGGEIYWDDVVLKVKPKINYLVNGGFETIAETGLPENWTKSSSTVLGTNFDISDNSKSGTNSVKMYGESLGASLIWQIVNNVQAGKKYEFSAQLQTVSLTSTTASRGAEVDIVFRDANNTTLQYNGANQARQIVKTISGSEWQNVNFDVVAPEGTASIMVYLRLYNGGGEIYWDDVALLGTE
ncbi:MAG: carbohydrate binding domain-containing protein, partial [Clostridia bacterium]|nr:carbohydrate binding domain-containing protein [Clostridia bacterium]